MVPEVASMLGATIWLIVEPSPLWTLAESSSVLLNAASTRYNVPVLGRVRDPAPLAATLLWPRGLTTGLLALEVTWWMPSPAVLIP